MPERKTYSGSCHCGAVRFEVETDLARALRCNCSNCSRAGWVLTFVPATDFRLLSGEESLVDYQFNTKRLHHVFCRVCGIHPFCKGAGHDGSEVRAVNLNCVPELDLSTLEIATFDGRKL